MANPIGLSQKSAHFTGASAADLSAVAGATVKACPIGSETLVKRLKSMKRLHGGETSSVARSRSGPEADRPARGAVAMRSGDAPRNSVNEAHPGPLSNKRVRFQLAN